MKIFDPKLTGSIEIQNTITGDVTLSGNLIVDGNLGGAVTASATASYVDFDNIDSKPTLLSGSAQIASDISGSFTSLSSSVASELLKNTTDTLTGDLTVTGTVTAQEFHTEYISASITYESGSHKFGDSYDDVHEFTGSVNVSNSLNGVSGSYTFVGGNFTVEGDDADFNLNITSGSALANLTEFRFQTDGGTMGRLYMHKGTKHMYLGPTYFPTSSLFLQDGTGTVMSITGSRVGIGTAEPQAELDIRTSNQQAIYAYTDGGYNALEFTSDGGATTGSLLAYNNTVRLGNASNVGGFSNGIIIDSNGNVGIGTATPSEKLTVNGNIETLDTIILNNGTVKWQEYINSNEFTLRYNGGSWNEYLRVDTDGNIGINTTNPVYKLDVRSTGNIFYGQTALADTTSVFRLRGNGGSIDLFEVKANGNVGIGSNAPNAKLDIVSTSDVATFKTSGQSLGLKLENTGGYNSILRIVNSNANWWDVQNNASGNSFSIDYNDSEKLNIDSSGQTRFKSSTDYSIGLVRSGTDEWWLKAYTDGRFALHENGVGDQFTILAGGNVGIGTTSPIYKLHVNSGTQAARFTAGDGGYAAVTFDGDAGNTIGSLTTHNGLVYLGSINSGGTGANGEIRIEPFGGNVMTLDSGGNVGIGNQDPLHKLSVSGDSYFSDQLRVDQPVVSWSDSGTKHYTHLATFSGYGSAASALIINTNIPGHNQSGNGNMFTFRIVGYAYGNYGLIDMLVGCYAGENNYYSAWWTGTCQTNWVDNVYVYTNSSGKVAFQIGETTDTLAAEIAITDFVQGFGNVNTSYADSWSCQAVTTLPTQNQKTTLQYKAVAPDIYEDVTFHNNVGIGDTTSIGSMTSGGGLLTIGRNGSLGTDDVVGALSFHTNDASFTAYHADGISAQISAHSDNPNGASGRLSFYTAYGGSRGERMRITSNGDVGIGNTSPYNYSGYKSLTIGNGSSTGLVKFGTGADANGPEIFSSTSTGGLIFNASSTGTRFRYYSNAGELSFSTNGTSLGNGVSFYAEHTSQSTGFHYYFSFLESKTNASAAGIKAGGILAASSYNVAYPDRGDIYAQDNISALSFTDRTPYPSSLEVAKAVVNSHQRRTDAEIEELVTAAYNRIHDQVNDMPQPEKEALTLEQYKAKYSKEYELDHSVLHDYVNDTKYVDQGIEARDLSATVSCLVEVVKDLMQRIDTLEGN